MRREDRRGGTGHEVDSALDGLYTVPPADFVARREELAGAARADGRAEDARRIHAARRPTLAAWAANLLLRSRPAESEQFLELGQALREAYRSLDADGLRELSARRRRVVAALSRQGARLARDAGHPLSDAVRQELESTLRAVLSDTEAAGQWAAGRLHSALTPPSVFPGDSGPASGAAPTARRPAATAAPAGPQEKDEPAERRREREARLAAARKAAEEAGQRLNALRAEHAEADARARRAGDSCGQARKRLSAAEEEVRRAGEGLRRAEREREEAERRLRAAADAVGVAEREARRAEREADRSAAGGR